jgi:exosome complex component RRP42
MPPFAFSPAELSYLHASLSLTPPIRPDSRSATAFRPLSAETDVLPATNGSAHLSFSDGSEAVVGVKAEVEKTASQPFRQHGDDSAMALDSMTTGRTSGDPSWVSLNIDLPTLRDDDPTLIFLAEIIHGSLVSSSSSSLPNALVINKYWHWKLYIDVLLISPYGLSSYPLPLLSLTVHLALLTTRLPKLKSERDEDPLFEDDWELSEHLYNAAGKGKHHATTNPVKHRLTRPPITLLLITVGSNIIFDPSREELAVADGIFAISVTESERKEMNRPGEAETSFQICSLSSIDPPARDTMRGMPISGEVVEGIKIPGVWQPRVGGIRRYLLKEIVTAVLGEGSKRGVASDVFDGVGGFLKVEKSQA